MDNPFDEIAKLVGKVLANRWLSRNAARTETKSSNAPVSEQAADSPTEHFVGQTDLE